MKKTMNNVLSSDKISKYILLLVFIALTSMTASRIS